MNTKTYEHPVKKSTTLKKILVMLVLVVATTFAANSASAQVRVDFEARYPGYTYYSYPAWHGHYRDRYYYNHYHARFEREHRNYFAGRRFDHERYERESHWRDHDHH